MNVIAAQNTFNVLDFGAVGNGNSDDSMAFTKAWTETCNANAETPTMIIPIGKTFLVAPVNFSGPCKSYIYVQLSGVIKAPDGTGEWTNGTWRWLQFDNITGLNISGSGQIDGNGQKWWDKSCKYNPAKAISFKNCKNVSMSKIYVVQSPQLHVLVFGSQDVHFQSLIIKSPEASPNTDGIHISHSDHVTVQASVIGTGDDCVSIGDHSTNIIVAYTNCGPGHGISIGSLGKDGNVVHVENITVKHINFYKSTNGGRIKTWQRGKGEVRHVEFSYLNFTEVENPIIIDQHYCDIRGQCAKTETGVHISDVLYSNAFGTSATDVAINLNCSENVACTDIRLDNVQLESADKGKQVVSSCNNAFGQAKGIVQPKSCLLP
ncbi:Pectin lyase-like superfamily protein [Melia azedarach]|uniref:Pectin lyase-like superfamily protein n=1 Tax=Melia azedarach TaxID=155640 RepID=A0ACC1Y3T6_MELAZ|nr:Pectin lyase-like superfamily protein [Melia azedarach]